jgi:hypothetical protein
MNETNKPKVYVVEVRGNDYYDDLVLHSVYADREAAEFKAAELRCLVEDNDDPCDDGELVYAEVQVNAVTLN